MLTHCIYSSTATPEFKEHEIPELLKRAREANQAREITGMLLHIGGSFFQVLEGDSSAVDETYTRISADLRHSRVTQIIREPISERAFGEWTMGFASVATDEVVEIVGANDFFGSASCLANLTGGRARKLLSAFRAGRWRTEHTGLHRAHGRVA